MIRLLISKIELEWLLKEGLTLGTIISLAQENRALREENRALREALTTPVEERLQQASFSQDHEKSLLARDALGLIASLKGKISFMRQRVVRCPMCSGQIDTPPARNLISRRSRSSR